MTSSFVRFAGLKFFAFLAIAVSLFIMLGAAQAGAAEPIPGMQCRKVALVQGGKVNETMLVCSAPGVVPGVRAAGVTTVTHMGAR